MRAKTLFLTLFLLPHVTGAGCKRPDPTNELPSVTTVDDGGKGPIDDAPLFDPDHLVEVHVELAPADLDQLRDQTRDFFEELSGDCTAEPFGSPFTWFEGEVTVDGELIPSAGVRKKGFLGSMSVDKPSLKISTDAWVDDQLMANGTERLTLNNNVQDPAVIQQCLGLSIFAAAGVPAPRCNFATVTLNGEPHGVYTHVEDVKKDFLRRHFVDDDGDLYEGTLSDFHPDWSGTFDAKTNDTDPDAAIVAEITAALDQPDDQVLAALGAIVDLDSFFRFWATESLVLHWDGYASNQNNFFVYRDSGNDVVTFMPWGVDQLFGDSPEGPAVFLNGRITQRLWATAAGRDRYVEAMEQVLAEAWDEDALTAEVDRMQALLAPHVTRPEDLELGADRIRTFIAGRRAAVEAQLPELRYPPAEPPVFREPFCLTDVGAVTSSFTTEWDTLETADPFAFPATLTGDPVPDLTFLGSVAGPGEYGEVVVATLGVNSDWSRLWQTVVVLPPGTGVGTWPVGFEFGTAYLSTVDLTDPYDEGEILGLIFGEVTLTEVGPTPGAPVSGTVSGTVLDGLL